MASLPETPVAAWDKEAEKLFTEHTIDEIKQIEQQKNAEIERKQTELRQLVGHSYRDLIEAADTIVKMGSSTAEVMSSVSNMQKLCTQLQNGLALSDSHKPEEPVSKFYGVAVQMKLLMDTPEKVWSALERHRLFPATYLYLLALTTYSNLNIARERKGVAKLFTNFPILKRQWASISHFRENIRSHSKELLCKEERSVAQLVGALASAALLDDLSSEQLLELMLKSRVSAVRSILKREMNSAKEQILAVVRLVVLTIREVRMLFCSSQSLESDIQDCLLHDFLKQVTDQTEGASRPALFQESHVLMQATPTSITNFAPEYKGGYEPLTTEAIAAKTRPWLETLVGEVEKGIRKVLRFVNSIERLATTRDKVWGELQTLNAPNFSLKGEDADEEFELCCASTRLLDIPQPGWDQRAQGIVTGKLKATGAACVENTKQALSTITTSSLEDCDLSDSLWQPGQIDTWDFGLVRNATSLPLGKVAIGEAVALHAGGFTPRVRQIYSGVNQGLSESLTDSRFFLQPADENVRTRRTSSSDSATSPFDRFSTAVQLRRFMQTACEEFIESLLQQLTAIKDESSSKLDEGVSVALDAVLFVSRVITGISSRCPTVSELILLPADSQARVDGTASKFSRFRRNISGGRSRLQPTEHEARVSKVQESLQKASIECQSLWAEKTATRRAAQFQQILRGKDWVNVAEAMAVWHQTNLAEESESGQSVDSVIRLPNQASGFVLQMLCGVCSEIARAGGHTLPNEVVFQVCSNLSKDIFSAYEALVAEHTPSDPLISPEGALQLLFDFRFINDILAGRKDPEGKLSSRAKAVIAALTAHVDPFDMDVFAPILKEGQGKFYSRSAVLLGCLIRGNPLYSNVRVTLATQESHNVLPVASVAPRFPTLPVGGGTTTAAAPPPEAPSSLPPNLPLSQVFDHLQFEDR